MSRTHCLTALALISLPFTLSQVSCTSLDCGEGTMEEDGECRPADSIGPNNLCGSGSVFNPNTQSCEGEASTTCDPNTTIEEVQPDGTIICVGMAGGCDITCKNPDPTKITVCGQLINTEDNTNIEALAGATGTRCDDGAPTSDDGPCSIKINAYNAVAFAGNPSGTPPLPVEEMVVNDCGQFMLHNVPHPGAPGYLALSVDDHSGSGNDTFAFAGVAFLVVEGQRIKDWRTYAVKQSTDQMWSSGDPFGDGSTFAERGVFFPIFMGPDTANPGQLVPYSGVQITRDNAVQTADDYYFSDTDPNLRTTVDSGLTATGANGAGLLVNSNLTNHGGMGAEPSGCKWPDGLAASLPGVVFASERIAEDLGTGEECQ